MVHAPSGRLYNLLFLLCINDLEQNIKSCIKFFADDTMLYSIILDERISAADLNHDLGIIQDWAYQWKKQSNLYFRKRKLNLFIISFYLIVLKQRKLIPINTLVSLLIRNYLSPLLRP